MSELGQRRHQARERALEILYEASMKDRSPAVVLTELAVTPDAYALELVTAADAHRARADELDFRILRRLAP